MYFKIRMGLTKLNDKSLLALARHVITMLTGNANYLTPNPPLLDLTAAADALAAAINSAMGGGREAHQLKRTAVLNMQNLMRILADYVNGVAAGNRDLILNAGFETNKIAEPVGILPAPEGLLATASDFEGMVNLDWDVVIGSTSYTVYIKDGEPDDGLPWLPVHSTSKSRATISDLDPGKFYWFRVTAFGTAGISPASDPARSFAA